jgi:hypothetical protein
MSLIVSGLNCHLHRALYASYAPQSQTLGAFDLLVGPVADIEPSKFRDFFRQISGSSSGVKSH